MTEPGRPHLPARDGSAPDSGDPRRDDLGLSPDLAPVARAIAGLPRPPLSAPFRARLHADLVRLEAELAARRDDRRPLGLTWLRLPAVGGSSQAHRADAASVLDRRTTGRTTMRLPAAVAAALAAALVGAVGLAYAAEHSRPGDALWPVRSAIVRWRMGQGPDESTSHGPATSHGLGAMRSGGQPNGAVATATIVRRTGRRPDATPGPVRPARRARADDGPRGTAADALGSGPPWAAADGAAAAASLAGSLEPGAPEEPGLSPAHLDPAEPAPEPPAHSRDDPRSPGEPAVATSPPANRPTAAPSPVAPAPSPSAALVTLSGIVRLRDGGAVLPLEGVSVDVAPVGADFPSGCDPATPPLANHRTATDAAGGWTLVVPEGRWIVAVGGGCLGTSRFFLGDFNGATTVDPCAALALPLAAIAPPSALLVVDAAVAPACAPAATAAPTATPTP